MSDTSIKQSGYVFREKKVRKCPPNYSIITDLPKEKIIWKKTKEHEQPQRSINGMLQNPYVIFVIVCIILILAFLGYSCWEKGEQDTGYK